MELPRTLFYFAHSSTLTLRCLCNKKTDRSCDGIGPQNPCAMKAAAMEYLCSMEITNHQKTPLDIDLVLNIFTRVLDRCIECVLPQNNNNADFDSKELHLTNSVVLPRGCTFTVQFGNHTLQSLLSYSACRGSGIVLDTRLRGARVLHVEEAQISPSSY